MPRLDELLDLARKCYAQARATLNPEARRTLEQMGDNYIRKAERLGGKPVQAVFPTARGPHRPDADT